MALVLALILSCAPLSLLNAEAAASDYIAQSYASSLLVTTKVATNLMEGPSASANAKYTLPADTVLTVQALHRNTSGEYWYEVLYYNMTLYVKAANTTKTAHLTGDVFGHAGAVDGRGQAALVGQGVDILASLDAAGVQAGIVDDHCLGLVFADDAVQHVLTPVFVRLRPVAVKPKTADLAVVGAKQLYALSEIHQILLKICYFENCEIH